MKHLYLYALLITTVHLHAADNQQILHNLREAIRLGNLQDMQNLLDQNNIDVNTPLDSFNQGRALHCASYYGQTKIVQDLLDRGAEVNTQNIFGATPLHHAATRGHLDAARELLRRNADVNAKDIRKMTPLYDAAHEGHFEMVKALIDWGADTKKHAIPFKSAAEIAQEKGHDEVAEYIRDYNDIPDTKGVIMEDMGN